MDVWNIAQKTLTLSPGAPAGPGGPIGPVIPRMPSLPGAPSVPLAPWSPWDKSLLSVLRICALQFNCCEWVLSFLSGTALSSKRCITSTHSVTLKTWQTSSTTLARHSLKSGRTLSARGTCGTSITLRKQEKSDLIYSSGLWFTFWDILWILLSHV